MKPIQEATIENAVGFFGVESQTIKAVEELAELSVELCKALNGQASIHDIVSEIADVSIMVAQLKIIYGVGLVDIQMDIKLRRLKAMIEGPRK